MPIPAITVVVTGLLLLLPALPARGQEPEPQRSPDQEREEGTPSLLSVPGLENLDIQTDSTTFEGADVLVMSGYVDIRDRSRDLRLQADEVRFTISTEEFEATGNVVFDQDELRLTGSRMTGELDAGTGVIENAQGIAPGQVYFRAESITQVEPGKFRIRHGTMTPCRQAVPIWEFRSRSMTLEVNDHASMVLPTFKIKGIPVAALPYAYWPLEEDGRATGFLIPSIGTSTNKGFMFSESFFLALGRSYDATFTYDRFSKAGNGFGAEFRHAYTEGSAGRFRFYRLEGTAPDAEIGPEAQPVPGGTTVEAQHVQQLPYDFRLNANANFFTSAGFLRGFEDSFDRFLRRESSAGVFLTRSWDAYALNLVGDHRRTFFGSRSSVALRRLPEAEFRIRSKRMGPLYLDFQGSAGRFERLESSGQGEDAVETGGSFGRLDAFPQVSMPVTNLPWLTFRPFFNWRSTYWTHRDDRFSDELDPDPISRNIYETGMEIVGPSTFRIFETPRSEYSPRFKHVIEPRISWRRRSEMEFDGRIIRFDEIDFFGGELNELFLTLTTRLFAKRFPDRQAEQRSVWEVLSVDFTRAIDLEDQPQDRLFPTIPLPYTLRTRFTPNRRVTVQSTASFTPSFGFGGLSVTGTMNFDRGSGQVTWIRSARTFPDPENGSVVQVDASSRLNGGGSVDLLGRAVTVGGHASVDVSERDFEQFSISGQWNTQCCSIGGELRRIDFSFRQETQFSVIVELANVGSIGFGEDRGR